MSRKPTPKDYKATIREAKPADATKARDTIASAPQTTLSAARMYLEALAIDLRNELRMLERIIDRCQ